jgi:2'-5' RNA ligase
MYHPEAIVLKAEPNGSLDPVARAVRIASLFTEEEEIPGERRPWVPHATLAYSTLVQPAAPLIQALGKKLPSREITIDHINLVIQMGPERLWDWRLIAEITLEGT